MNFSTFSRSLSPSAEQHEVDSRTRESKSYISSAIKSSYLRCTTTVVRLCGCESDATRSIARTLHEAREREQRGVCISRNDNIKLHNDTLQVLSASLRDMTPDDGDGGLACMREGGKKKRREETRWKKMRNTTKNCVRNYIIYKNMYGNVSPPFKISFFFFFSCSCCCFDFAVFFFRLVYCPASLLIIQKFFSSLLLLVFRASRALFRAGRIDSR